MMIATLLTLSLQLAHAEQTADVNKNTPAASATHSAPKEEAEAGGPLVEEASLKNGKYGAGFSWRNTQVILMGAGLIKCRLGGVDARRAAVPALKSAGYCDVTADKNAMNPKKMPQGTVWVYDHSPHGNTIVKTKDGSLFDNRDRKVLPNPRGAKVTVMKPNCGPKAQTCGDYKTAGDKTTDDIMHPSQDRLQAEESCGYANAFRATDAFNECVEDKLTK